MYTAQEQLFETIDCFPSFCLSQHLKKVYQQGKKVFTKSSTPLLVTGERGTGKEFLAKSIHYLSSPLQYPFFVLNCAHLAFDHFEKKLSHCVSVISHIAEGVPTDDSQQKAGGTIFLRDIGKLSAHLQDKVFHLLQETCYKGKRSAGAHAPSIHLIFSYSNTAEKSDSSSAINETLHTLFHQDTLNLLPLRDRAEDIQPLASFFVDRFSKEYGKDIGGVHSEALNRLNEYTWPYNVTELKNVMENAVLLAQGPLIVTEDIRFNISKKSIALESFFCREDFFKLEEIEKIYIQTVLRRVKNNKSKAAKILGITRNTLQKRIETLDKPARHTAPKKKSRQQALPLKS
jgi:DNA-binding NtrC family response regulator